MWKEEEIKRERKRKSKLTPVAVSKTVGWGFESLLACG
jgi:hypothetical protein